MTSHRSPGGGQGKQRPELRAKPRPGGRRQEYAITARHPAAQPRLRRRRPTDAMTASERRPAAQRGHASSAQKGRARRRTALWGSAGNATRKPEKAAVGPRALTSPPPKKIVAMARSQRHLIAMARSQRHVSGIHQGLELTTSSLRQNSSWASFSTLFSLPCINTRAQIRTVS